MSNQDEKSEASYLSPAPESITLGDKALKLKGRGRPQHKLDRRPPSLSRSNVIVVLNEPQKPENIGAAARAVANTGLGGLVAVRPRTICQKLMANAATIQALPVLQSMLVYDDLRKALAPYQFVVGATARVGAKRGPFYSPRQLAPTVLAHRPPSKVAILFGPERMGLSTVDLRLCHKIIRIPTHDSASSSLNLAQAVLIVGYELLLAAGGEPPPPPPVTPARLELLERMYEELESCLTGIGFLPADNSGHWLSNIRKIFNRSLLSSGECDLLLGLCRQIRWAVKNLEQVPLSLECGPGPKVDDF